MGSNNLKQRKLAILSNTNVDYKKEVIAGITTFLAMAYIIAVNPAILSKTSMPAGPLVTATCLSAALATIIMGLYANLPLGLASGMGLNAFFAYTVVLGKQVPWTVALTPVFVEGVISCNDFFSYNIYCKVGIKSIKLFSTIICT